MTRHSAYRVVLPDGPFVLRFADRPDEGHWDPTDAHVQDDGAVVLLSDGLPVTLRVVAQSGWRVRLDDGSAGDLVRVGLRADVGGL